MTPVRFDAVDHRYYLPTADGEVEVPSVTTILKLSGQVTAGNFYTEEGRERGTAFHLAAQYLDEGRLDWSSVIDPHVRGKLDAYLTFLEEQDVTILALEQAVGCPTFLYAGTFDRILRLNRTGVEYIVDFKPTPAPWHRLQVSAYARITGHDHRACLYVRPDGTYRWTPHHGRHDAAEFLRLRRKVGESWKVGA